MKLFFISLFSVLAVNAADKIPADQLEFFESKIRPVLAESCYECHNSVNKKKGKLALDWREPMMKGGSEGLTIVPGKPEESLLIKSIRHEDDLEMPSKAPKLSDAVIADFVKWIKMGAPDPRTEKPNAEDLEKAVSWEEVRNKRSKWWSFQPLKYEIPPKPEYKDWQNNPVDSFIFAKLKDLKLRPSEKADKFTLLRRVHLVLTGLPPSTEDIHKFIADKSPEAYVKVVDKLLSENAYGERWARHWMDWYRYAESHGSEGDPRIPYAEAYRDYLIRALNNDVPYDLLLKEHIAGDLLKNPRINKETGINESAIGPAHFRLVPHGFGVTDAYDEQITFTDNQIDVLTKAMMGVTVSCARCHNHKFDPISQKDFYRLYGIMISNKPSTVVIDSEEKQQKNKKEIAQLKNELRKDFADIWLNQLNNLPNLMEKADIFKPKLPELPKIPKGKKLSRDERNKRNAEQNRIRQINQRKQLADSPIHPFGLWTVKDAPSNKIQAFINNYKNMSESVRKENNEAIKEADFYLDLTDPKSEYYTSGNGIDGISPAGSFALNSHGDKAIMGIYSSGIYSHLTSTKHAAIFSTGNFKVTEGTSLNIKMAGQEVQARTPIRNYPMTHGGLHPATILKDEEMKWHRGPGRWHYWKGDTAHFELRTAKDIIPRTGPERSWFGVQAVLIGKKTLKDEGASILDFTKKNISGKEEIIALYKEILTTVIKKWATGKMSDKEAIFLQAFVNEGILKNDLKNLPENVKSKINHYRKLENEIPVPKRAPGLMEAEVIDQPLMTRGDYKKEAEKVQREFLEIFGGKPYKTNSGRLELAEDMVSTRNTLKSRVLVNRIWAYVFGEGIVKSTDNFGRLGSKPSHPELLDFLSDNFEKNGWSIKKTLKLMVTSRAFMSSSQNSARADEVDPENVYLSYFTPRRLDAEAIHDTLYTIAGRKFQRAVFDRVIRNNLNSFLSDFNRPTPVSTVSRRLTTNVPAQALTMMNDITPKLSIHTMNIALKQKTLKTDEEKLQALFLHCYNRPPTKNELRICKEFLSQNDNDWKIMTEAILNSKEIIYVY